MGAILPAQWMLVVAMMLQAVLLPQHTRVMGATTAIDGEQIEGSDPCPSGDDSAYGSNYQVVATKPSSQSDITSSGDAGLGCQEPVQICGAVEDVEAQCRQTAGCVAFSYDGRCGYLKTSDQPRVQRSGWVTYILASSSSSPAALPSIPPSPSPSPSPTTGSRPAAGGSRALLAA